MIKCKKDVVSFDQSLAFKELVTTFSKEFLHEKYGNDYVIPHKEISLCLIWIASWFNSMANNCYKRWGFEYKFDTCNTKKILGINFIDAKTATYAMVDSLIENGYIPDKRKKK